MNIKIKYNKKLKNYIITLNTKLLLTIKTKNNNINISNNINLYLFVLKILRQFGLIKIKNNSNI
jgi:hypothetical protein